MEQVNISVKVNGETGYALIDSDKVNHVCGNVGFGQGGNDRCERCEADRRAADMARAFAKITHDCNPMAYQ